MSDKRRARQGSKGGNLTPAQAKKTLALPIYAVLRGQAVPIFPGTSLAAPSGLVGIFRKPGFSCRILAGKTMVLPVWLNDRQWERAVVPVLERKSGLRRSPEPKPAYWDRFCNDHPGLLERNPKQRM